MHGLPVAVGLGFDPSSAWMSPTTCAEASLQVRSSRAVWTCLCGIQSHEPVLHERQVVSSDSDAEAAEAANSHSSRVNPPVSRKDWAHHRMVWETPDVPELTFRSAVPADVDSILLFWKEAAEDSNRPTYTREAVD